MLATGRRRLYDHPMCAQPAPNGTRVGIAASNVARRRGWLVSVRRTRACLAALAITTSMITAACSTAPSASHTPKATNPSPANPNPAQSSGSPSTSPDPSPSPSASPSASPSVHKPVSAVARIRKACPSVLSWDNFHRSNRSLHRDRLPTGQQYYASGPYPQRIRHDRFVSPGYHAPDILYVWLQRRPVTVAARWVFSHGQTSREHAVIGLAPRHAVIGHRHLLGFGIGSVQLAIYPDHWLFFYVTNANYSVQYHTIAIGYFSHLLSQDGRTVYQMAMTLHPENSSITIIHPGGRNTFESSAFEGLWGRLYGLQVTRAASDGNVSYVTAGSASAPCKPSSLLGGSHTSR